MTFGPICAYFSLGGALRGCPFSLLSTTYEAVGGGELAFNPLRAYTLTNWYYHLSYVTASLGFFYAAHVIEKSPIPFPVASSQDRWPLAELVMSDSAATRKQLKIKAGVVKRFVASHVLSLIQELSIRFLIADNT